MLATMTVVLKPGEALRVGEATVRFERKSGSAARLHVSAPPDVPLKRANHAQIERVKLAVGERRSAPKGLT